MPLNDVKNEPRLVRAGKIRLGYKAKWCKCRKYTLLKELGEPHTCRHCGANLTEAKESPVDSDHFVLDDVPELVEIYGPTPTRLNIYFPFNTIEENMPSSHKMRQGPFLTCQGNGTGITYAVDPLTGRQTTRDNLALVDFQETGIDGKPRAFSVGEFVPCPGRGHNLYAKCRFCKPSLTLRFMIREVPRMATFEIISGSLHNYLTLDGQMTYFNAPPPAGLGISLKYVPFYLNIGPRMVSAPNLDREGRPKKGTDGKPSPRIMIEKQLLTLEIEPAYMARLTQVQRELADPGRLLALPAPVLEITPADEPEYDDEELPAGQTIIYAPAPAAVVVPPAPAPVASVLPAAPAGNGKAGKDQMTAFWLKVYKQGMTPDQGLATLASAGQDPAKALELLDSPAPAPQPATSEAKADQAPAAIPAEPPAAPAAAPTEPAKAETPINGHGRPFQPAQLKEALGKIIAKSLLNDRETGQPLPVSLHPKGDKVGNLVSARFQEIWTGDPEAGKMYHSCLRWLTGKGSSKDLSAPEAEALLIWLVGKKNYDELSQKQLFRVALIGWTVEEAKLIHREALKAAGQGELFEPAEGGQPETLFPLDELDYGDHLDQYDN